MRVTAELREQLAHAFERIEKMKRLDTSPRTLRDAVFDAQHDRRTMKALDNSARHNPDHAPMPSVAPKHQRRIAIRNRRRHAALENLFHDGTLRRLPFLVQGEQ